jgi:hypothetical protein
MTVEITVNFATIYLTHRNELYTVFVYLFTDGLFNKTVSSSEYIASDNRKNGLERIRKEAVVAQLKVLPRTFLKILRNNNDKTQSGLSFSRPRFEPGTPPPKYKAVR